MLHNVDGGIYNTEACGYDGGDCLECNSIVPDRRRIGETITYFFMFRCPENSAHLVIFKVMAFVMGGLTIILKLAMRMEETAEPSTKITPTARFNFQEKLEMANVTVHLTLLWIARMMAGIAKIVLLK